MRYSLHWAGRRRERKKLTNRKYDFFIERLFGLYLSLYRLESYGDQTKQPPP